jgi:Putative adipose-regulatory protein (Seipin)
MFVTIFLTIAIPSAGVHRRSETLHFASVISDCDKASESDAWQFLRFVIIS